MTRRGEDAEAVLRVHHARRRSVVVWEDEDRDQALVDLLRDLRHWADDADVSFRSALRRAEAAYWEEATGLRASSQHRD
jgi:hypothetical protein